MTRLFEWHERGQRVELFTLPGIPGAILEARSDGRHGERIELPARALAELVVAMREHVELDADRIEALEEALGVTEAERDEHRDRANAAEADLARALGDIETLRTAVDLADRRARAVEVERDELLAEVEGARSLADLEVLEHHRDRERSARAAGLEL